MGYYVATFFCNLQQRESIDLEYKRQLKWLLQIRQLQIMQKLLYLLKTPKTNKSKNGLISQKLSYLTVFPKRFWLPYLELPLYLSNQTSKRDDFNPNRIKFSTSFYQGQRQPARTYSSRDIFETPVWPEVYANKGLITEN